MRGAIGGRLEDPLEDYTENGIGGTTAATLKERGDGENNGRTITMQREPDLRASVFWDSNPVSVGLLNLFAKIYTSKNIYTR